MISNISRGAGLKSVWGIVQGIQLITHMPLMSVNLPSNSLIFYSFLIKPAQFQITNDDPKAYNSSGSFNFYFERMNYKFLDMISNLGSMFYMLAITLCLVAFALLTNLANSSHER